MAANYNSFVSIKISLINLVFELIIQKNFYSQTIASLVRLILMHTKEFLRANACKYRAKSKFRDQSRKLFFRLYFAHR